MADKQIIRKWVAMLVLTLGLGMVWGMGIALLGMIGQTFETPDRITEEGIEVASDGTPLIQTYINGDYQNVKLRTLENKKNDQEIHRWLDSAWIDRPFREPRWFSSPITWRERIAGVSNNQKPPTLWLAIREAERPGNAYFVGYNAKTRQIIGYLGRAGYRSSLPARDEWFSPEESYYHWGYRSLVSRGEIAYRSHGNRNRVRGVSGENRLKYECVYLVDDNKVQEIDLVKQEVRTIASLEGLKSLRMVTIPLQETGAPSSVPEGDEQDTKAVSKMLVDSKHKTADRLLANCGDRVVLINPADNSQQTFKLPEEFHGGNYSVYGLGEDQLLLMHGHGYWESGRNMRMLWLDTDGKIGQEKIVQLLGRRPTDPTGFEMVGLGIAVPSLLPWLGGSLGYVPIRMLNFHETNTYRDALNAVMPKYWLTLAAILVLSVFCTWQVARWQRMYCRENTVLWCATVFLFAWPALMAYWVLNRRPVMEECGECRAEVPRDRDACARCEAVFAEPGRLGTEIFA